MDFFNSLLLALGKLLLGVGILISLTISNLSTNVVVQRITQLPSPQTTATSTVVKTATTTKKAAAPAPKKKAPTPLPKTQASSTPPVVISNDTIVQTNTLVRASLVNILCTFRTTNTSSYISGSGLIVDPRGVILTNAHVAQFLLLQNYPSPGSTSCVVRTGSPAVAAYTVELLYLPPLWVSNNASQILSNSPTGTGERDYAFLYITGIAQFAPPLPSSFPALTLSSGTPKQNGPVLLAGYPAGLLDGNQLERSLYASTVVSTIQQLYTFNSQNHVDLVSLGGTVVSQGGSSGGAVIDLVTGKLAAVIVAESEGTTTASRDLRALTLAYINRSLGEDGKGDVASLVSGDLLKNSQDFNANIAPALAKKLITEIETHFK